MVKVYSILKSSHEMSMNIVPISQVGKLSSVKLTCCEMAGMRLESESN